MNIFKFKNTSPENPPEGHGYHTIKIKIIL